MEEDASSFGGVLKSKTAGIPNYVWLLILIAVAVIIIKRRQSANSSGVASNNLATLPYFGGFPIDIFTTITEEPPTPIKHKKKHHKKPTKHHKKPPKKHKLIHGPTRRRTAVPATHGMGHSATAVHNSAGSHRSGVTRSPNPTVGRVQSTAMNHPGAHITTPHQPPSRKISTAGVRPTTYTAGSTVNRAKGKETAAVHHRVPDRTIAKPGAHR